jgi:hypothetical protein
VVERRQNAGRRGGGLPGVDTIDEQHGSAERQQAMRDAGSDQPSADDGYLGHDLFRRRRFTATALALGCSDPTSK